MGVNVMREGEVWWVIEDKRERVVWEEVFVVP